MCHILVWDQNAYDNAYLNHVTGSTVQAHRMMYKSVAQKVMLYDSEIWVVMRETLNILEDFYH